MGSSIDRRDGAGRGSRSRDVQRGGLGVEPKTDVDALGFLGNQASVEDGERKGIALALDHATDSDNKLCVLTYCMSALSTCPGGSLLDRESKAALRKP